MRADKRTFSLLLFIILGALFGSIIGEFLSDYIPSLKVLSSAYNIGTRTPFIIDLRVLSLTFGITINFNIMSIIGVIVSIILYKKY